jgi:hypothetical protein
MNDDTVLDPIGGVSGGDRLHGRMPFVEGFLFGLLFANIREISFENGKL